MMTALFVQEGTGSEHKETAVKKLVRNSGSQDPITLRNFQWPQFFVSHTNKYMCSFE